MIALGGRWKARSVAKIRTNFIIGLNIRPWKTLFTTEVIQRWRCHNFACNLYALYENFQILRRAETVRVDQRLNGRISR